MAEDCRSLAHFTLKGIPPMVAGMARLEVRFEVDADGLLTVSAKELTTSVEQKVEVKPSYGLAEEDIERMLLDAYEHAEDDVALRSLREQRVDAERVMMATRGALEADADLLEPGEQQRHVIQHGVLYPWAAVPWVGSTASDSPSISESSGRTIVNGTTVSSSSSASSSSVIGMSDRSRHSGSKSSNSRSSGSGPYGPANCAHMSIR